MTQKQNVKAMDGTLWRMHWKSVWTNSPMMRNNWTGHGNTAKGLEGACVY